ncbi:MAG TPA: hypothetical protein P5075_09505 [Eubacteriales bacterium]|mgnify:CR=1 FL=1|nr:hypothetical protein [Eubacteriales bacterium]
MSKRRREEWVDDGRVIASMDVDGIPNTFRRGARKSFDAFGKKKQKSDPIDLTRKEKRSIAWGTASAYLLVLLVFAVAFTVIFLLMGHAWR